MLSGFARAFLSFCVGVTIYYFLLNPAVKQILDFFHLPSDFPPWTPMLLSLLATIITYLALASALWTRRTQT